MDCLPDAPSSKVHDCGACEVACVDHYVFICLGIHGLMCGDGLYVAGVGEPEVQGECVARPQGKGSCMRRCLAPA